MYPFEVFLGLMFLLWGAAMWETFMLEIPLQGSDE